MNDLKIFDISPEISAEIAIFPGDTPFSRNEFMSTKDGDHLTLSSIKTTLHLGAHTDAPVHYHPAGSDIASINLNYYLGDCQVIEVNVPLNTRIRPKDLPMEVKAPRVLIKTNSYLDPNQWTDRFNSLSGELIYFMASKGVKLIGIDTPSIDLASDKTLESHSAVFEKNMAILEGVILKNVDVGIYKLIATPLRIKNADASPVRAILLKGIL